MSIALVANFVDVSDVTPSLQGGHVEPGLIHVVHPSWPDATLNAEVDSVNRTSFMLLYAQDTQLIIAGVKDADLYLVF